MATRAKMIPTQCFLVVVSFRKKTDNKTVTAGDREMIGNTRNFPVATQTCLPGTAVFLILTTARSVSVRLMIPINRGIMVHYWLSWKVVSGTHSSSPSLDSSDIPVTGIDVDFDGEYRDETHPDIDGDGHPDLAMMGNDGSKLYNGYTGDPWQYSIKKDYVHHRTVNIRHDH